MADFIVKYWVQIGFICTIVISFFKFSKAMLEATKCSLRNDILSIYNNCKEDKKITMYELQAIEYSYEEYKKLKGNSFVDEIHEQVKNFEIVD